MAQDFSRAFYNSRAWEKCRLAFLQSKYFLCERCGGPATIAHHIVHLNPGNIGDPMVTLNWDNMMSLCTECHQKIHGKSGVTREGLTFNTKGELVRCGYPPRQT